METHRKINIFRLDPATEDAASEKHFADVSFYLNKTHISEIDYEIARRAHGPLRAHSCRARVPDCVLFILPKNHPPENKTNIANMREKNIKMLDAKIAWSKMSLQNVTGWGPSQSFSEIGPCSFRAQMLADPTKHRPTRADERATSGRRAGDELPTLGARPRPTCVSRTK